MGVVTAKTITGVPRSAGHQRAHAQGLHKGSGGSPQGVCVFFFILFIHFLLKQTDVLSPGGRS